MPFIAVLALVLLLIAALGQTFAWWRGPNPPNPVWYGPAAGAAYHWGIFFLAMYIMWPTLQKLGL